MTETANPLDELQREVGRRRIAAGDARTAVLRRVYDAPIEEVWDAITNPKRLNRFFLPISGDLREGGTFSIQYNASGEILRCDPPNLVTLSWAAHEGHPADQVEIRLSSIEDGKTALELEHASVNDVFLSSDPKTGMWGVGPGWEAPLRYLAKYLSGELPDAPTTEWYQPNEQDEKLANDAALLWSGVIETAYARLLHGQPTT
jgi:uncharacterized protein YndB with AHSA1/START domain